MVRQRILKKPTKINELIFEYLYDEISHDWQSKARRLQARRWRLLKHDIKGFRH